MKTAVAALASVFAVCAMGQGDGMRQMKTLKGSDWVTVTNVAPLIGPLQSLADAANGKADAALAEAAAQAGQIAVLRDDYDGHAADGGKHLAAGERALIQGALQTVPPLDYSIIINPPWMQYSDAMALFAQKAGTGEVARLAIDCELAGEAARFAYSPNNPPPVTSVNGMTGQVAITAAMLGAPTHAEATNIVLDAIAALDVEADRAVSVTGAQSNMIEGAAAHTNRMDNPHAVSPEQIGAASLAQLAAITGSLSSASDRIVTADGLRWLDATGGVWQVGYTAGTTNWYAAWGGGGLSATNIAINYSEPEPLPWPLPSNFNANFHGGDQGTAYMNCQTDETYQWYTYAEVPTDGDAVTVWGTTTANEGFFSAEGAVWFSFYPRAALTVTTSLVDTVALVSQLHAPGVSAADATNAALWAADCSVICTGRWCQLAWQTSDTTAYSAAGGGWSMRCITNVNPSAGFNVPLPRYQAASNLVLRFPIRAPATANDYRLYASVGVADWGRVGALNYTVYGVGPFSGGPANHWLYVTQSFAFAESTLIRATVVHNGAATTIPNSVSAVFMFAPQAMWIP